MYAVNEWILNMDWVDFWLGVSAMSMIGILLGYLCKKHLG